MSQQSLAYSSDESVLAAISHFFGWLVALFVWATQKDKSPYVRFQSMQALAFDLITSIAVSIAIGCMAVFIFIVLGIGIGDIAIYGNQANPLAEPIRTVVAAMAMVPLLIPCIIVPLVAIIFIARLIATVQTLQGKDFRYPWLGTLVARYQQS
jgi:uncharacterized Tic20 family protein